MALFRRLFWILLVMAAFVYGFVFGSDQIAISDVQVMVVNRWDSVKNLVGEEIRSLDGITEAITWLQDIFEKAYGCICNLLDAVI